MLRQQNELLHALCCTGGWTYAVIWRIRSHDSMLLMPDDAYCDDGIVKLVEKILHQVHVVGEGIIGQVAFSGLHRWFFADTHHWESSGFQDTAEWSHQFLAGIQTVALIPVAPWAVLQFGSQQKIFERVEYVGHVKSVFRRLESAARQYGSIPDGFRSIISANDGYKNYTDMPSLCEMASQDLAANTSSQALSMPLNSFLTQLDDGSAKPFASAEVILPSPSTQIQGYHSSAAGEVGLINFSKSTWLNETSSLLSLESKLMSEVVIGRPPGLPLPQSSNDSVLCHPIACSGGAIPTTRVGGAIDDVRKKELQAGTLLAEHHLFPLLSVCESQLSTKPCTSKTSSILKTHADSSPHTNLEAEALAVILPQPQKGNNYMSSVQDDHVLPAMRKSRFSGLEESETTISPVADIICSYSFQNPANAVYKSEPLVAFGDSFGVNGGPRQGQQLKGWEDFDNVGACDNHINFCDMDFDVNTLTGSQKVCGADHLLEAVVGNLNTAADRKSDGRSTVSTITGAESSSGHATHMPQLSVYTSKEDTKSLLPQYLPAKASSDLFKSTVSSWISGSCSESGLTVHTSKSDEPVKVSKKRARPGESTRPRPKDRQMIQDRVKELREIVPDGAKCSIDALLDRTIKHMLFLQNVTKYAEKLKQVNEPKMIAKENGVVLKDKSNGTAGGVTWAFEVGGQTMFCPIIVEDSNPPGQMLVEMLCEERGFFLEIAEIIRSFGLTILKGLMEIRDGKIWARFIVEANREVTRMDIFLSLVQLLQQTTSCDISPDMAPASGYETPNLTEIDQTHVPVIVGMGRNL